MTKAYIVLYRNSDFIIYLEGELILTDSIRFTSLHLHSPNLIDLSGLPDPVSDESFSLQGIVPLEIPAVFLKKVVLAGENEQETYQLTVPAEPSLSLSFSADLLFANAGEATFLGMPFALDAGFSANFTLQLPVSADPVPQPSATIEFCGYAVVDGELGKFASAPLCFQADLIELFEGIPSPSLPQLDIELPDFGFDLPRLRLPWTFPQPLSFPFTLPSLQFPIADLPISVRWKSARLEFDNKTGNVSLTLVSLRIGGESDAIEGDLQLVWQDNSLNVAECFFHLYKPDFRSLLRLQFSQWFFDEDCLLVTWQKGQINEWLRLLLPDLADTVEADIDITFRILRDNGELTELRMDWIPESERELTLPGIDVTLPAQTQFSLIYYRPDDTGSLAFVVTEAVKPGEANPTIIANSALTFHRETVTERELLTSGQEPLIRFEAIPSQTVSVALLNLQVNYKPSIEFFRQLATPLRRLEIEEFIPPEEADEETNDLPALPRFCSPTEFSLERLGKIWGNSRVYINLPVEPSTSAFKLPFLDTGLGQFIEVRRKTENEPFMFKSEGIEVEFKAIIHIATNFSLESEIALLFDWETFAVRIKDGEGIKFKFKKDEKAKTYLGLNWTFTPAEDNTLFVLVTKNKNYQLRQATGSRITVELPQFGASGESLTFQLTNVAITPTGIDADGQVSDSPIKLGGLNTQFRFTKCLFRIAESRIQDFCLTGSGALPPKLIGDATATIDLHFSANNPENKLKLVNGGAQLQGKKLIDCRATRFQFTVNGLGLRFVNNGRYHFYFTITGSAKFVPLAGDPSDGPLSWLPGIEIELNECPLTDDARAFGKGVKFLTNLEKKPSFDFLGCFRMELRGIGFIPQAPEFGGEPAMVLSGQVMFAQGAGDVIDTSFDFHQLSIGLPEPGQFLPRIHFKGLGVKLRVNGAFSLEGSVDFFDRDPIEPGLVTSGFAGSGLLSIQDFLDITATFTFVRVSRDGGNTFVRAWFIYIQAEKLSIRIPILDIFIREIGLGFGYRYTLASIKRADELDNPKALIKELQQLSLTQGNLSNRNQWRADIEEAGKDPRWTIAARMMIAQNSAAKGMFDYDRRAEELISSLFLLDVVLGVRSDLTILMTVRAWLNTNYEDFRSKPTLRNQPFISGFALLSVPQRRFLAHMASNPGAEYGDHPPLPGLIKEALSSSNFPATLLMEPNLIHFELGWPNQLRWGPIGLGPLRVEFSGGTIFRISDTDIVYGTSFQARGSLELAAQVGGNSLGARISAVANVAYGGRYIGIIGIKNPLERSALYGAVGIDIQVRFLVEFWLKIKALFFKINIHIRFEFTIQLTALVEVGVTAQKALGASGTATVMLSVMGRNLHFKIHVGINQGAVDQARQLTSKFLDMGFEAAEAPPIPGTTNQRQLATASGVAADEQEKTVEGGHEAPIEEKDDPSAKTALAALIIEEPASAAATTQPDPVFVAPNYSIYRIPSSNTNWYFLLYPNEIEATEDRKQGFLAVPPTQEAQPSVEQDYEWTLPPLEEGVKLSHYDPEVADWKAVDSTQESFKWRMNWTQTMGSLEDTSTGQKESITLRNLLQKAYITTPAEENTGLRTLTELNPIDDPDSPVMPTATLEDPRVYNPSDTAFESAVRGAVEQFEGSPNLRRDTNSVYEANLANAFGNSTSVYAKNGQKSAQLDNESEEVTKEEKTEQVVQLRSLLISQLFSDFQKFAETKNMATANLSVAFQAGLIFQVETEKDTLMPDWLRKPIGAGQIRQRTKLTSLTPDSDQRSVRVFNIEGTGFSESTPHFQRVQQSTDANTIALTWDLVWSETIKAKDSFANLFDHHQETQQFVQPDHFLKHYLIRRRTLTANEPEVEFKIKPIQVLNFPAVQGEMELLFAESSIQYALGGLNVFEPGQVVQVTINEKTIPFLTNKNGVLPNRLTLIPVSADTPFAAATFDLKDDQLSTNDSTIDVTIHRDEIRQLRPRYQFTDNFNHEPISDQAALHREGKTYLYTITPVDVTGTFSPRPLTIVATRRATFPPVVPGGSELQITYHIVPDNFTGIESKEPTVFMPERLMLAWTKPASVAGQPTVPIDAYRLIFRKEKVLPVGFYGLDSASEGNRNDGLPSTNARKLPTDIVISLAQNTGSKFRVKETTDPNTKEKRLFIEIEPKDLAGVLSQTNEKWRPESWQVFLQTEGRNGAFSALVAVKISLQFKTSTTGPLPDNAQPPQVERNPALLEFITLPNHRRMLAPEDEKAQVGFVAFPMPNLKIDSPLGKSAAELIQFKRHPVGFRAVQLTWNQSPSRQTRYPVNLQAGYQLYEFDLGAHTVDVLNSPPVDFLQHLRPIQQVQLLSKAGLAITPHTTAIASEWEAWYPSTVRRMSTAANDSPSQLANAHLSPWFSWRESYLDWVSDNAIVMLANPLISAKQQLLQWSNNATVDFIQGQFVRITGAKEVGNNGIKQISSDQSELPKGSIRFVAGTFVADQPQGDQSSAAITIDIHPEPGLHPWLQELLKKLDSDAVSVDVNPLPNLKADNLDVLQQQTAPKQDPYGWTILKLMGLSVDFTLRDRSTGRVLEPDRIELILHEIVGKLLIEKPEAERYLFLDYLFQPSKSQRLDQQQTGGVSEEGLLSLVQISLRPIARQHFRYWFHRVNGRADFNQPTGGTQPTTQDLTITFPSKTPFDFIEVTRSDARIFAINLEDNQTYQTSVQIPPAGEAILLFRSTSATGPTIEGLEATLFDFDKSFPHNVDSTLYFDLPLTSWIEKFEKEETVTQAWQRFNAYLLRLGSQFGATNQTTIDIPAFNEPYKIAGLLDWLNRFFEVGADIATTENGLSVTGGKVNFACAYPRVTSPVSVTIDEAKRITYFHRINDRLAHEYRYYILPEFRYDRLWETLANSDILFPDRKPAQSWFVKPEGNEGGLDVVIDRIQEVSAPLLLSVGRLDEKTAQEHPVKPGAITELIIARHQDQLLSVRNRTNLRQLDFQGISIGTLRRFAFGNELAKLNEAGLGLKPQPTPPTTFVELPGTVSKPAELNLTALTGPDRVSLDLPTRIGEFGREAEVFQFQSLPFYYEHLFLLVAQTSTLVSPVTTVVQREFEYESPKPSAQYEAQGPDGWQRNLTISIDLKRFWDSLSADAQARWPSEEPINNSPDTELTYSALPDTGVIYQISLTDLVKNVEAQAEFKFNINSPIDQLPYLIRPLGSVLAGKLISIEQVKPKVFALRTEFAKSNILLFPKPAKLGDGTVNPSGIPIALPTGDFTLLNYQKLLIWLFPKLQPLTGPNVLPEELTFMLRKYTAITEFRESFGNLIKPERPKIQRVQKGDQSYLVALSPLNQAERLRLQTPDLPADDLSEIIAFCDQIENRLVAETFFSGWISEEPISSRHQFGPSSDRLEFPAPMSCVLNISVSKMEPGRRTEIESVLTDLRKLLKQPLDNSFANAVRLLIEQLASANDTQLMFTAEACVGLEQFREIASDEIISIDEVNRQLTWKGKITESQEQVLNRWCAAQGAGFDAPLSDFGATIKTLLQEARGIKITIFFDAQNSDTTEIPVILTNSEGGSTPRLHIRQEPGTPGELVWSGLVISFEEARALTDYTEAVQTAELKAVLVTLLQKVEEETISVPILESDWKPRPQQHDLTDTLRNHLLIGNGLIRFWGWMTTVEGNMLKAGQSAVDKMAIRRLYDHSMQRGLSGTTLQITASRGAAERKINTIYLTPLSDE